MRPNGTYIPCKYCAKEFYIRPCEQKTKKYCSNPCRSRGTNNSAKRKTGSISPCIICTKPMYVIPCRKGTRFCSHFCGAIGRKIGLVKNSIKSSKLVSAPRRYKRLKGNSYVFEHRHIMETFLGRPLGGDEHIHHKNGNHLDNRIENLEILTPEEHAKKHILLNMLN